MRLCGKSGALALSALDRPIWSALAERQRALSEGGPCARRFARAVSPFAAARDDSPASLRALASLVGADGDAVAVLQAGVIAVPEGLIAAETRPCVQMVLERPLAAPAPGDAAPLGAADAPEMLALAAATEPGPFGPSTHLFGGYWGLRRQGRLIAMAGERLKAPGFSEVSAVCVDPDHRGRGYAKRLTSQVAVNILARGETPFLHACVDNRRAIALYERLGFRIRRAFTSARLKRAA